MKSVGKWHIEKCTKLKIGFYIYINQITHILLLLSLLVIHCCFHLIKSERWLQDSFLVLSKNINIAAILVHEKQVSCWCGKWIIIIGNTTGYLFNQIKPGYFQLIHQNLVNDRTIKHLSLLSVRSPVFWWISSFLGGKNVFI